MPRSRASKPAARRPKPGAARPSKSPVRPSSKSGAKVPPRKPAPVSKGAPSKKAPPKPEPPPPVPETRRSDGRRHLLSLSFVRDGDEFLARLETDSGHITELKNRALDQLLTLVAGELEDLLE
jgi:hypothetical protein